MSDSERYMLIFSLTIFFGMMALGLVVIHSNNQTTKYLERLVMRQAVANTTNHACYTDNERDSFIQTKMENAPFMHFLEAKTGKNKNLAIYLNATPGNDGAFFIVEDTMNEDTQTGCIIAEGNGMKIVIPEPPAAEMPTSEPPKLSEEEIDALVKKAVEDTRSEEPTHNETESETPATAE